MSNEDRDAIIKLPFPGVKLERFTASESLSELFTIEAFVICETAGFDFFPHLGKAASIKVSMEDRTVRWFHGLIYEAEFLETEAAGFRHRLVLRPWLHLLGRNQTYTIFQGKSVKEILETVFQGYQFDILKLQGSYAKRDYCVQYRESDLAFVSRLMEDEGIYYFFEHLEDRHVLTLCDGRRSHAKAYAALPFNAIQGGMETFSDRMWRWQEKLHTGGEGEVRLHNSDFKQYAAPRTGEFKDGERQTSETAEVFDYPSDFITPGEGATRSQMILEAARRHRRLYVGQGDALALACGKVVGLSKHPIDRFCQDYLVTRLVYSVESQSYRSGDDGGEPALVNVEATPLDTPWRAPFVTPRPVARGPETAIVTGPADKKIYTDEFGRVKVRFYWDRSGSEDISSTCWIRVSHPSAGKGGLGNIILPRIGHEVIVDFVDGDPDRPIITGRLYNATNKQPYALDEHQTRSVWQSQTIGAFGPYDEAEEKPTAEPGFNEIRMEDKGGFEEVYVHAQRDMKTWVRHDDDHKVARDQKRRVGRNRVTDIKKNETLTVETGDETRTIDKGKRTTTIEQDETLTVRTGNMSIAVKTGNYDLKTDAGSITAEAMQKITLKVGANSIVIDQSGITIKGLMVKIEATGILSAEGLTTDIKGKTMTTIKGAMVMIN